MQSTETPIEQKHQPVLLAAVLNALPIQANKLYVDGTLGLGGHTQALMQQAIALNATPLYHKGIDEGMLFLPLRWTERIDDCRANAMVVPTDEYAIQSVNWYSCSYN